MSLVWLRYYIFYECKSCRDELNPNESFLIRFGLYFFIKQSQQELFIAIEINILLYLENAKLEIVAFEKVWSVGVVRTHDFSTKIMKKSI